MHSNGVMAEKSGRVVGAVGFDGEDQGGFTLAAWENGEYRKRDSEFASYEDASYKGGEPAGVLDGRGKNHGGWGMGMLSATLCPLAGSRLE